MSSRTEERAVGAVSGRRLPPGGHHTWPSVIGPAGAPCGVLADRGGLERSHQAGDSGLHGHPAASGDVFAHHGGHWRVPRPLVAEAWGGGSRTSQGARSPQPGLVRPAVALVAGVGVRAHSCRWGPPSASVESPTGREPVPSRCAAGSRPVARAVGGCGGCFLRTDAVETPRPGTSGDGSSAARGRGSAPVTGRGLLCLQKQ